MTINNVHCFLIELSWNIAMVMAIELIGLSISLGTCPSSPGKERTGQVKAHRQGFGFQENSAAETKERPTTRPLIIKGGGKRRPPFIKADILAHCEPESFFLKFLKKPN